MITDPFYILAFPGLVLMFGRKQAMQQRAGEGGELLLLFVS